MHVDASNVDEFIAKMTAQLSASKQEPPPKPKGGFRKSIKLPAGRPKSTIIPSSKGSSNKLERSTIQGPGPDEVLLEKPPKPATPRQTSLLQQERPARLPPPVRPPSETQTNTVKRPERPRSVAKSDTNPSLELDKVGSDFDKKEANSENIASIMTKGSIRKPPPARPKAKPSTNGNNDLQDSEIVTVKLKTEMLKPALPQRTHSKKEGQIGESKENVARSMVVTNEVDRSASEKSEDLQLPIPPKRKPAPPRKKQVEILDKSITANKDENSSDSSDGARALPPLPVRSAINKDELRQVPKVTEDVAESPNVSEGSAESIRSNDLTTELETDFPPAIPRRSDISDKPPPLPRRVDIESKMEDKGPVITEIAVKTEKPKPPPLPPR